MVTAHFTNYVKIARRLLSAVIEGHTEAINAFNKAVIKAQFIDEPNEINFDYIDAAALLHFEYDCFIVSGAVTFDLQNQLKNLAIDNIQQKRTYKEFVEAATQIVDTGAFILKTNYDTAFNAAYNAAQFNQLQRNITVFPAYQYKTMDDDRVRETHMHLNDKIYMHNDPIWDTIYPPNGWNCRCRVEPLTRAQLIQQGGALPLTDSDQRKSDIAYAKIEPIFARNAAKRSAILSRWASQKYGAKHLQTINLDLLEYKNFNSAPAYIDHKDFDQYKKMTVTPKGVDYIDEIWLNASGKKTFIKMQNDKFAYIIITADGATNTGVEPITKLNMYRDGLPCI